MVDSNNYYVHMFYGVCSWEGVPAVPKGMVLDGLLPLSRIHKIIGYGDQTILGWAMFNYFDAYWVAGTFFANLHKVKQCAKEQEELLSKPIQKMPAHNAVPKQ